MGRKKKFGVKTFTITVITLTLLAISLFPYYYMVLQSFTAWDQVDKVMVPHGFTLRSYEYLIGKGGTTNSMMWVRALINSFLTIPGGVPYGDYLGRHRPVQRLFCV